MVIEGAPSIIIMILTVFFWFKGSSRETILMQEGKLSKNTIIDDRFQTVSVWKQVGHIASRFNLVLIIINGWLHMGVL